MSTGMVVRFPPSYPPGLTIQTGNQYEVMVTVQYPFRPRTIAIQGPMMLEQIMIGTRAQIDGDPVPGVCFPADASLFDDIDGMLACECGGVGSDQAIGLMEEPPPGAPLKMDVAKPGHIIQVRYRLTSSGRVRILMFGDTSPK